MAWRGLPHARARERVVPIYELVFGTLTQNRSSLEPSLGFAAIAGPPCIVDRVPYVQALEEPKRDPKRLWRIRLDDGPVSRRKLDPKNLEAHAGTQYYSVPPSIRKINSKGTAVLNARRAGSRLLRFGAKVPNTSSEIGTTLSRARACGSPRQAKSIQSGCSGGLFVGTLCALGPSQPAAYRWSRTDPRFWNSPRDSVGRRQTTSADYPGD